MAAAGNAPDPDPNKGPQTQKVGAEAVHDQTKPLRPQQRL